jgi:hypothetical protein
LLPADLSEATLELRYLAAIIGIPFWMGKS